jgi:hypothetical protein
MQLTKEVNRFETNISFAEKYLSVAEEDFVTFRHGYLPSNVINI